MNESEWLKGKATEEMLDWVEQRFTPRRWRLLAVAFLRRRWDVLPEGLLREIVETVEIQAAELPASQVQVWLNEIDANAERIQANVRLSTEEVVRPAAMIDAEAPTLTRPNQIAPAFPLFSAADRYAQQAIELAGPPGSLAIGAVRGLLETHDRATALNVANRIEEALFARSESARAASVALRFKQQADEIADIAAGAKNKRIELAKAEDIVSRYEQQEEHRVFDEDASERAVRKVLGRFLHELVGNPFGDYRFEAAWRTETVIGLARAIDDERAFDRMPILADALLDADCDSEAVLRHLRGTEKHTTEKATHLRGCWVIDRILRPDDPVFQSTELSKPKAKRKKKLELDD
jgi:hypothetical protein